MSVETMIVSAMRDVPKAVAAGVIDMESGMLLGVKTVDSHPQDIMDMAAAATKEIFEGDTVLAIEEMWKSTRGVSTGEHYFQEIVIMSTNLVHCFGRLKSSPATVLCTVCRSDVNFGLMLTKVRSILGNETI